MNIQKVKIANALESTASDGVVAESSAIFDQGLEMYQDVLNTALSAGLIRLEEKDVTSVSAITTNVTAACSITGASNSGKTEIILYKNDSNADLEVTVPTTYVTPDGTAATLSCPANGFCKVTFSNVGGTVYADVQTATSSTNAVMKNAMIDYEKTYLTFVALESGTFTLTVPSGVNTDYLTSVSYSLNNGKTWVTTQNSGEVVTITTETIPAGSSVLWKGSGTSYSDSDAVNKAVFSSTGNFDVEGNIMSLLHGDDFEGQKTLTGVGTFNGLFSDCTKLIHADKLVMPATTLTANCYSGMFNGCSALVSTPELPSLSLAPRCYLAMFRRCTSLTVAPKLPATTLANYCYQTMFQGCTALVKSPELPAETLAEGCYNVMFMGCTSLSNIKCLATNISATNCTGFWVNSVAATGTFVKNPSMADWEVGTSGIPSGWTVINGFPDSYGIQPDWDISDMTSEAYVRNKPTIPAAQIQSDWGQSDTDAVDYIKNKPNLPKEFVILSYGHTTWAEAYSAYTENRVVYCRASSNSNPASGDQLRMAFLAYVNNVTDPTELEFQYYRSVATKNASNYTDQVFAYKFNKTNGWSVQTRSVSTKISTGANIVSAITTGANPVITLSAPNVATLVDGKVPASQLPSYVDDVIELLNMTDTAPSTCATGDMYYNTSSKKIFTATGTNTWGSTGETPESGKIYVNLNDNTTYRWGGSDMAQISASLVIGTTQGTAADGKVVNDHVTDNDIHVTTSDKTTWSGKQDAINDLSDIRAGAASGATAYQVPSGGIPLSDMTSGVQGTVTSAVTSSTIGLKLEIVYAMPLTPVQNTLYIVKEREYVEIGGIKWATMNVGANSITDTGLYFQWGDISGYTSSQVGSGSGQKAFDWADYKFNPSGDGSTFTKYNSTDGKTVLDAEDDAVAAAWGGSWRMPTTAELQALSATTTSAWTTDYQGSGVNGLLVTDKTDSSKTLFFPVCGYARSGSVYNVGSSGFYWSSSPYSSSVNYAYFMSFNSSNVAWGSLNGRCYGFSVRGVLGD